ncbi:MAG: MarR family transcriptional regulator [Nanoarchaeota archaeon]|nr:MarR family transcriptional regulator [Nanoarchaeota archaeon]
MQGKYTVELFAKERNLTRQSAINLLSKLKKQGYVTVSGGGRQKRIYTVSNKIQKPTNGFYSIVNKYSPEKLQPDFKHYTYGNYTIEHAIIDGIKINNVRTRQATMHLFRHIRSWKRLFQLAKKHNLTKEVINLYYEARKTTRCKTMPKRYQ